MSTLGRPGPVVVDVGRIDAILEAFADGWSTKIICSTIERAKTVGEICTEEGLPQSSCYKRIKRLVDDGLMIVEQRILTGDGKKSATYRSSLSFVSVKMVDGKINLRVGFNPGIINRLDSQRLVALWKEDGSGARE
jgi:hypothetical protein